MPDSRKALPDQFAHRPFGGAVGGGDGRQVRLVVDRDGPGPDRGRLYGEEAT